MRISVKDFDAHWRKQNTGVEKRVVRNRKWDTSFVLYVLGSCFIFIVGSSLVAQSIEVQPNNLCFVVKEDGDIVQKVRLGDDFSTYSSFQVLYKPEAIRVVGLDKLNSADMVDLDVILEIPEGMYQEIKDLFEELTREKIEELEMSGRKVSKRELPSMSMFSRLEILVIGNYGDTYTINIPLKVVFDFSKKRKAVSSEYVE